MSSGPNEPCVVWGSCFLWHVSIVAICWSLLLIFCVYEALHITGTDVIIALFLLSGLLLLPTNMRMIGEIASGNLISHDTKVMGFPIWTCFVAIIIVNFSGVILCMHKIILAQHTTGQLNNLIKHYKNVPKFKHFVDNLQWTLKCCGMKSYRDWFDYEWSDVIRDYEWDPTMKIRRSQSLTTVAALSDSVPLSCCKSGSCSPNYLQELGTNSINTRGCGALAYKLFLAFMIFHLSVFLLVIIIEINLLKIVLADAENMSTNPRTVSSKLSRSTQGRPSAETRVYNTSEEVTSSTPRSRSARLEANKVKHIMLMKSNYNASSASFQLIPDESISEELEKVQVVRRSVTARHIGDVTTSEMDRITGTRRY